MARVTRAVMSSGVHLEQLIGSIKKRIESGQYHSETAIRETIILPVLQALGWDVFDPNYVLREYPLGSRRVDYALSSLPPRRDIFVEVKSIGQALGADRQLFEYAFHEGIPFAILTDGREWNFFLPAEQGSYDERRVHKLDFVERPAKEVVEVLHRYLDADRVRSGSAIESARADYKNIARRRNAANHIPRAWRELVTQPDSLLMDLIAEKTETACGLRPAPEDVEAFLIALSLSGSGEAPAPKAAPIPPAPTPSSTLISERGVQYRVLGQSRKASNAIEAVVDILRTLAERNPQFVQHLAQVVPGRTRNHIATSRNEVYPNKPELTEYTMELIPGWWLGTNIANRDKMRIIEKACHIEHLTLGKDIVIKLPNA